MDWVVANRLLLSKASADTVCKHVNPNLFNLEGVGSSCATYDDNDAFVYPALMRLTRDSLSDVDWCLLDDGFALYQYILKPAH